MTQRLPPTRAIPPLPPHFVENFIEGGWRAVERLYGSRDDLILAWIEMAGGLNALQRRRHEYLRQRTEAARALTRPSAPRAA